MLFVLFPQLFGIDLYPIRVNNGAQGSIDTGVVLPQNWFSYSDPTREHVLDHNSSVLYSVSKCMTGSASV